MKKPSFISRLTGNENRYDDDYFGPRVGGEHAVFEGTGEERHAHLSTKSEWNATEEPQGELAVDVYQTPDAIVVKALLAGVQPGAIDISLTREMLTISGTRSDEREVEEENYFQRELYWGSFSTYHFIARRNRRRHGRSFRKARHPHDPPSENQQETTDEIESA
jgi:HSP20 family molecular chaperone IbpA